MIHKLINNTINIFLMKQISEFCQSNHSYVFILSFKHSYTTLTLLIHFMTSTTFQNSARNKFMWGGGWDGGMTGVPLRIYPVSERCRNAAKTETQTDPVSDIYNMTVYDTLPLNALISSEITG